MRLLPALLLTAPLAAQIPNFESPQITPIAISDDGSRLATVNTPDNRVALFSLQNPNQPFLLREIAVGLEPVSVRFRNNDETWVVNHLSDSVSVVDLDAGVVTDTIFVDDEPSDIVFANGLAFVTVSTRRHVAVIDPNTRSVTTTVAVFGDEPRWAAASDDGSRLYVASHKSGNETTAIPEAVAPPQPPPTNGSLPSAPDVGLIVHSEDPTFSALHDVDLPDYDVFEIDTTSLTVVRRFSAVGTILFGMAVRPTDGSIWATNTEARNLVRFEPELRGHLVDHRVTRITTGGSPTITAFDLNPGVDYDTLPNPGALATALAQPTDALFDPSGSELFVAAFGTDRIGVLDGTGAVTARIEIGSTPGTTVDSRNKRGPRGLAHHPTNSTLYVLNRLSNTLSIVDTVQQVELLEMSLVYDPTPTADKEGRGFLYDAKISGNGTASCAVCHIDATTDNLGWDLGDPGGTMTTVPGLLGNEQMHPMKGPMTTQSLVGLGNMEPFHWRGDRVDFQAFNPAFDKLMGGAEISGLDMDAYAAFIDTVRYPPNPNQNRDRTYTGLEASGENLYVTVPFVGSFPLGLRCVDCHSLITGSNNIVIPGNLLNETQAFKVPQLRNIYKRDGRRDSGGGLRTAGFGLLHDGTDDDVFDFLGAPVFQSLASNTGDKLAIEAFVEAFDTGMAPAVGFSVTLDASNYQQSGPAADRALLTTQAQLGNCDLVARGTIDGEPAGLSYDISNQRWRRDEAGLADLTGAQLDSLLQQGAVLTLIGVPLGQGLRIGIDRDADGTRDGDEGIATYGSATPGCSHTLRANSPAFRGNDQFGLVTEGATPGSLGAVFLGFAPSSLPFLGIDILVDLVNVIPVDVQANANGVAMMPLAIPDDAGIQGVSLYLQSIFVDGCGTEGLAASAGLSVVIE